MKKTIFIPVATIIAAVVSVVLNLILVPIYGYEVSAYVSLLAYLVLFLSHYFVVRSLYKVRIFNLWFFAKHIIILTGTVILLNSAIELIFMRYLVVSILSIYYIIWLLKEFNQFKIQKLGGKK